MPDLSQNPRTVTVSSLVMQVKRFLESKINLNGLWVSGEISNCREVKGHCYFDLKDENGQISCTMWRSRLMALPFRPENGISVLVQGSLNLYEKRGTLSLNVTDMTLNGIGLLYQQLEETKRRLQAAGLFEPAHKKPRPAWINRVALVTGDQTAALQDVMKTIRTRWPMLEVTLFPALVQGQNAPQEVVRALKQADQGNFDAILLVRGGGSFEDLFCFNDERIVKALYDLNTYCVTGIGHEIDTTLADLAADHRAVTPTAAAQWITPDQNEIMTSIRQKTEQMNLSMQRLFSNASSHLMYIQSNPFLSNPLSWLDSRKQALSRNTVQLSGRLELFTESCGSRLKTNRQNLENRMADRLHKAETHLSASQSALILASPKTEISLKKQLLASNVSQLEQRMKNILHQADQKLVMKKALLEAISPSAVLERGYSIIRMDQKIVDSAEKLKKDDRIQIILADGEASARIEEVEIKNGKRAE